MASLSPHQDVHVILRRGLCGEEAELSLAQSGLRVTDDHRLLHIAVSSSTAATSLVLKARPNLLNSLIIELSDLSDVKGPARAVLSTGETLKVQTTKGGVWLSWPKAWDVFLPGCEHQAPPPVIWVSDVAWHAALPLETLLREAGIAERRVFCLTADSLCSTPRPHLNEARNGALAHYTDNGLIASYVPSGSPAALVVPLHHRGGDKVAGIAYAKAWELEGNFGDRAWRCLGDLMRQWLKNKGDAGELKLSSSDLNLALAVSLVLLRRADPSRDLWIDRSLRAQCGGAWRRLFQHLNIGHGGSQPSQAVPAANTATLDLQAFANELAESWLAPLLVAINKISDVIPPSLDQKVTKELEQKPLTVFRH